VRTIHGQVTMKVNPGTQPGEYKRLKGKGLYDSSNRRQGDHIVQIQVSLPKISTDAAKAIERALVEQGKIDPAATPKTEASPYWGFLRWLRFWLGAGESSSRPYTPIFSM
jgi:DnaJ-class molecular chaperone